MKSRMGKAIKPPIKSPKLGHSIVALAGFTTLLITPSLTIDAFNPPKFALLVSGVGYLGIKYWKIISQELERKLFFLPFISLFMVVMLSLIVNTYSISERIFGIEGRNFGFITTVALTLLGFYSFQASRRKLLDPSHILNGLTLTNVGVCLVFFLQESGVILTGFNNVYTVLPSTLGNPNFLSAYLGISVLAVLNRTYRHRKTTLIALLGIGISSYSIYIIVISGSIQGLLALAVSLVVLFLIFSSSYFSRVSKLLMFSFLGIVSLILASSFLGVGPLGERLAQQTLRNRFIYWEIAVRMVLNSPIFGKGYDSYLDFYRVFVAESDFEYLGGPVISDSPHNIFLDLFVSGGLFLGVSFLVLVLLVIRRGLIHVNRDVKTKTIDLSKSSLYAIFLALIAICLISPFQIGVMVWLSVLIGALLGIDAISDVNEAKESKSKNHFMRKVASVVLGSSILFCNPISAALPLATEIRFRTAVEEASFAKLSKVALDWPISGSRAISISQGFFGSAINIRSSSPESAVVRQQELLEARAIEIALETVKINEREFQGWQFLLRYSSDSAIREKAKQKLRELDPFNPEWKLLP